jgi:hypothetical protein
MPPTQEPTDPDRTIERTNAPDRSTDHPAPDRTGDRSTDRDRSTATGGPAPASGEQPPAVALCAREGCGNPVAPPARGGRPRRYCCDAHRAADRRARRTSSTLTPPAGPDPAELAGANPGEIAAQLAALTAALGPLVTRCCATGWMVMAATG